MKNNCERILRERVFVISTAVKRQREAGFCVCMLEGIPYSQTEKFLVRDLFPNQQYCSKV